MSTQEQIIQKSIRTPDDIAKINSTIIRQRSLYGFPNSFEDELAESWEEIADLFVGKKAEVDPSFVSGRKSNIGYLGLLHVAEVEIPNNWDWDPQAKIYVGPSLVVELKCSEVEDEQTEPSIVVLALPDNRTESLFQSAVFTVVEP